MNLVTPHIHTCLLDADRGLEPYSDLQGNFSRYAVAGKINIRMAPSQDAALSSQILGK